MKRFLYLFFTFTYFINGQCLVAKNPPYGQLKITGTHLTKLDGTPVQLRGMSLFWSQWVEGYSFFNNVTISKLKCSWNANIVRAAMGVQMGGYLTNPEVEYERVKSVIEAAIRNGIYVIVDWHDDEAILSDHTAASMKFFNNISLIYGSYPHVIYEIFNEPYGNITWDQIKQYHEKIIPVIRANDPNNIIVLGTPSWSSYVDVAAKSPVNGTNLAYTMHFYAASHGQSFRDRVTTAIGLGLPIFVTEYGVVEYTGNGHINETESEKWWSLLDQNKISYVNWAIDNKNESSAALIPGSTADQVGDSSHWSFGGTFVNKMLWSHDQGLVC